MHDTRYRVEHETRYVYAAPVSQSWQLARLTPRVLPWQRVHACSIRIDPAPDERHESPDSFGNTITHFGLLRAHRVLTVHMACDVDVSDRPAIDPAAAMPWEQVRAAVTAPRGGTDLEAALLREPTRLLPLSDAARRFARASFPDGADWFTAVSHLMARIHAEFEFDPEATTVSTSVDEVLVQRRGVCQDFAHLMIACLRAMGLPARYVSGYLLTDPPPGSPRLMGVDASHAWVAAWSPVHGWVEFDPTNGQGADQRYITLGWGGDFADIGPLRGILLGSGGQDLQVSVSVTPV